MGLKPNLIYVILLALLIVIILCNGDGLLQLPNLLVCMMHICVWFVVCKSLSQGGSRPIASIGGAHSSFRASAVCGVVNQGAVGTQPPPRDYYAF